MDSVLLGSDFPSLPTTERELRESRALSRRVLDVVYVGAFVRELRRTGSPLRVQIFRPRRHSSGSLASERDQGLEREALLEVAAIVGILLTIAWAAVALMLSAPLLMGRAIVKHIMAVKGVSDLVPMSLGAVAFSGSLLLLAKLGDAAQAICARLAVARQHRSVHLAVCVSFATVLTTLIVGVIPLGFGSLTLKLALPLRTSSSTQVPIVFMVTDCWTLGLVITKALWRFAQLDVMFHALHLELAAVATSTQNSPSIFLFDLPSQVRVFVGVVVPVLVELTLHLALPWVLGHTLCLYWLPEGWELLGTRCLMYSYHVVALLRLIVLAVPAGHRWLSDIRQRIFDEKYLVSTELQDYEPQPRP